MTEHHVGYVNLTGAGNPPLEDQTKRWPKSVTRDQLRQALRLLEIDPDTVSYVGISILEIELVGMGGVSMRFPITET